MQNKKELKKKIQGFYDVETEKDIFEVEERERLSINGRYIPFSERTIYLRFGEELEGDTQEEKEKNAEKNDNVVGITGEELHFLFRNIERDKRMENYIKKVKQNIGFLKYNEGCDSGFGEFEKFEKSGEISGFAANLTGSGNVDIGKNKEGNWVAEFTFRCAIDDFAIVNMIFKEKPTLKKIQTARLIDKIETEYRKKMRVGEKMEIQCWECSGESHFLDITHSLGKSLSLQERWENYKENYCGC